MSKWDLYERIDYYDDCHYHETLSALKQLTLCRPASQSDLVFISEDETLYMQKLTVGFESNTDENSMQQQKNTVTSSRKELICIKHLMRSAAL